MEPELAADLNDLCVLFGAASCAWLGNTTARGEELMTPPVLIGSCFLGNGAVLGMRDERMWPCRVGRMMA